MIREVLQVVYPIQRVLLLISVITVALCVLVTSGMAESTSEGTAAGSVQSPKVQLLLDLLGDQDIQTWVKQQRQPAAIKATDETERILSLTLANRLEAVRQHLSDLVQTLPKLPEEVRRIAAKIDNDTQGFGILSIFIIFAIFVSGGLLASWLFHKVTVRARSELSLVVATEPRDRSRLLMSRLLFAAGSVIAFAVGSILAFWIIHFSGLVGYIVLALLVAGLISWAGWSLLNVLLNPSAKNDSGKINGQRVIPLSDEAAHHFTHMLSLAVTWFTFGYVIVDITRLLGMDFNVSQLVGYGLGLGLLFIGLYAIGMRPSDPLIPKLANSETGQRKSWQGWIYALGFIALWVLWAMTAMNLFWLLAICLFLPIAIQYTRLATHEFFQQPTPQETESNEEQEQTLGVWAAVIERGLRAILIFGACLVLAWGWGLGISELAGKSDLASRLAKSALSVLTVFLIGDLLWQIIKTAIDSTLQNMPDLAEPGKTEPVRVAKLRTLLPIIRNVAMVFLLTLTIMMGLSALGVQIGPLIASAGVVGIAIGFGAQTLVKDVISGMFYLFDDAFRVGEYIIADKYKGTVESFSLRSVRLRHHRGPIYTIPFGDLGAVQNLSRDFVIDKLSFHVSYDTDLEKARKLIKQVGQELAADPEIGANILTPLKMQRVENFGDYGIEIKTKMTCVPGGQWEVRQKIYPLIKKRFEENGIEFARPTVKVSDTSSGKAAAAGTVISARTNKETLARE